MTAFEIGRICTKLRGREAGEKCVVIDIVDENYVLIDGPRMKRRRCNVRHLDPTGQKVGIKKGAPKKEVDEAFKALK